MSSNAFLTGSQVYGTPHEDSDLDFVVLVEPDTIDRMREFLGDHQQSEYPPTSASIRFGKLNIIATTDEATFNAWKQGTEILTRHKPVERNLACDVVKSLLALVNRKHEQHCPKPQRRLPAPG